ncbi:MAG: hypothetical protein GY754_40170 [bacterium]|nr:hypothetical protein [bacterium]
MTKDTEIKKLERRAKSLLMNKEIPAGKMQVVRTIMDNKALLSEERNKAIIDLVQNCPDKKVERPADKPKPAAPKAAGKAAPNQRAPQKRNIRAEGGSSGPQELSTFVNALDQKYAHLKLFRKRLLVHRNNRFGIGFRKRLIPNKRFLKMMQDIGTFQEQIIVRISPILVGILNDEEAENPAVFNYLRLIRKWIMDSPLSSHTYDTIKWMERQNFEREFKSFIVNYFSFQKLGIETREEIILEIENRLRSLEDLEKEQVQLEDPDPERRAKEKRNLAREKQVYEYMMLMRFFLASEVPEDCRLSKHLKNKYRINDLTELFSIIGEVLLFQRPVTLVELISYYRIFSPQVSKENWDYSEDYLKKVGKDPLARQEKQVKVLQRRLKEYETRYRMLTLEYGGHNILMKAVHDQWKFVDKRERDLVETYKTNFFTFLDGVIQYFKNTFIPFLDGTFINFKDKQKKEYESAVFSPSYFEDEIETLGTLIDEVHFFRSNNPTLAISLAEVKKIMTGQIATMSDVKNFIVGMGDFFYKLGNKLQVLYDLHGTWEKKAAPLEDPAVIRIILKDPNIETGDYEKGKPIPFYDCVIEGFQRNDSLTRLLVGRKIYDLNSTDGIITYLLAFSYQAAYECINVRMLKDLKERKALMKTIKQMREE